MDNREKNRKDYYTVDLFHVAKSLWRRAWLIGLCGLLVGFIGFFASAFVIAPTYSSYVKLYVNNSSVSMGNNNFSISSSELTAAQSLVKTYGDILDSRSTLERVIEKANVQYTWKELSKMITYAPSNGTEIMRVTVTCEDPYEASMLANTIAEILPVRISEIIDGASMEIVESATPDLDKVGPSIAKFTLLGLALGILGAVVVVVVLALLDDTIHDEEYVLRTYNYPILGKVPNLLDTGNKAYGYYSQKSRNVDN